MAPLNTNTTISRNAAIKSNSCAKDWESLLTVSQATHSRKCALCFQFLQLVEAHFREQRAVAFYARQLHVCPDYLLQCCKKTTGLSPSHCIAARLVLEAKVLLSGGGGSIYEQLGFEGQSAFCHFFKRHTGLCASEYSRLAHEAKTRI